MSETEKQQVGPSGGLENVLISWILNTTLFEPNYPERAAVKKEEELLTSLIKEFIGYSKKRCEKELVVIGYTPELASKTAKNVVLKTVTFVALFLARMDLEFWLPKDFMKLSAAEQKQRRIKLFEAIYPTTMLGNMAYFMDEYYDRDKEKTAELGDYDQTAIAELVRPVIQDLEARIERGKYDTGAEISNDIFKQKLIEFVDIYIDKFPLSWSDLEGNDSYISHLKSKGLLALYPLTSFLDLLSTAHRDSDGVISYDGKVLMQDLTITLADVWNNELTGTYAHQALKENDPTRKIPMPSDFKRSQGFESAGFSESHSQSLAAAAINESLWIYMDAARALPQSQTRGQGLEMVVNEVYYLQSCSLNFDEQSDRYILVPKDEIFREPSELLKTKGTIEYIDALDTVVRIADDVSDFLLDIFGKNPNTLAGYKESRLAFYTDCIEVDAAAGTNLQYLLDEIFKLAEDQGNLTVEEDENHSYWVEKLLAEIEKAKQALYSTISTLFAADENATTILITNDLLTYIKGYDTGTSIAVAVGTPADDMVFAAAMQLAYADVE